MTMHRQSEEEPRPIQAAPETKEKSAVPAGITVRETELTDDVVRTLIAFTRDWEAEHSCYGYRANTIEDLEGRRVFVALEGETPVGYLFGVTEPSRNETSIMPEGTPCFETEELYVAPAYRSRGIGSALFRKAADAVRGETEYITLSTATKNWRAILYFYLEELGMEFWSARLFKKL